MARKFERFDKQPAPLPSIEGRVPPNDPDTEKVVLATLILEREAFFKVQGVLDAKHFFGEGHQLIYEAIVAVHAAGQPIDLNTVRAKLAATGKLERAGGTNALSELTTAQPTVEHIQSYAAMLVELAHRREFIATKHASLVECFDTPDFRELVRKDQRTSAQLLQAINGRAQPTRIRETVEASVVGAQLRGKGENIRVTATGMEALDSRMGGGFYDENLTFIAGRPGLGKTSLALSIAANVAQPVHDEADLHYPRLGVVFFELEMPKIEISDRLICMRGRVPFDNWRRGDMEGHWPAAEVVIPEVRDSYLWIDDSTGLNMFDIEARVRAVQAEWDKPATYEGCPICRHDLDYHPILGRWYCAAVCTKDPYSADALTFDRRRQLTREQRIAMVMIDNLSLVHAEETYSREREVAGITSHAKNMSKRDRLNLHVVLLAHLSRDIEKRKGKEKVPQMSDIRETGSAEQDADNIIAPYRRGYYRPDDKKIQHEAQLYILKQRNGSPGIADVRWEPTFALYEDLQQGLPAGL